MASIPYPFANPHEINNASTSGDGDVSALLRSGLGFYTPVRRGSGGELEEAAGVLPQTVLYVTRAARCSYP